MGLSNALFTSVTGLDTASTAISVIGDNIANANTPGFKENRPEFSNVLGQSIASGAGFSQIGAGARVSRISTIFTQGSFETSQRPTDLAIEGRGFFVVEDGSGRYYSRAGIFGFDSTGLMVNSQDGQVQGYGIDPTTNLDNGILGDIRLNTAVSPPRPSTEMKFSMNLNQNESAVAAFDPSDPTGTTHFRTVVKAFDSLGGEHQATVFLTKTGTNSWTYNIALPPSDTSVAVATAGDTLVVQPGGTGVLSFSTAGVLTGMTGGPLALTYAATSGAASPQSIALSFGPISGVGTGTPTSQYEKDSALNSFVQDGYAAGSLTSLGIDDDGYLNAVFDNGETTPIARIALADFGNVEGLQSIGNNAMVESRLSGQPLVGAANSGALGGIRSSAIEQSNVDLATQFVKMIVAQRAFQANTRTVSVTNELMANLVNLGG